MFEIMLPLACFVAVPLLLVAGVTCLVCCRGTNWRHLVRVSKIFVGCLALLLGGEVLLGFFQLTWRNLPGGILAAGILVSGILWVLLVLGCLLPAEMREVAPVLRWGLKGTTLLCAALVVYTAVFFGGLVAAFAYGQDERVIEHQGQTLVEVEDGWLDTVYEYYEYHGPLVRGSRRLYDSMYEPLDGIK